MSCLYNYAVHAALVAYPDHRPDDVDKIHYDEKNAVIAVHFSNGDVFYYC